MNFTPALRAFGIPYLLFMLFLGLADLVEGMKSSEFLLAHPRFWIYPLQTIVCGGALIYFWKRYSFDWPKSLQHWGLTIGIAVLVLVLWISPQEFLGAPPRVDGFNPDQLEKGSLAYWATLSFRFLRLVIVVPLLEEIFCRGFLLRYLVKEDFESVAPGTFTWVSFGGVALFFGLAHWGPDFWPAIATGVLYNLLMILTRSLGACVIAHAITNLLLGIYIMKTGQWGFW